MLQAMDAWLKEYREKLAEAGGMADRNPHADSKGEPRASRSSSRMPFCLRWHLLVDMMLRCVPSLTVLVSVA